MKYLFSIFIFLLPFQISYSQQTWDTKIDYENTESLHHQSGFTKTIDGNYLFMYWRYDEPSITGIHQLTHTLAKFDTLGELLWQKYYDQPEYVSFNNGLYPRGMVEMSDGKIAVVGSTFKAPIKAYLYITESNGDSLTYMAYPEYYSFRKVARYDENKIMVFAVDEDDNEFLLKIDINTGGIIETNSLNIGYIGVYNFYLPNDLDYFYYFPQSNDVLNIKKYSHSGSLLAANDISAPEGFDGLLGGGPRLIMNPRLSNNGIALYQHALLTINENLSPILSIPFNLNTFLAIVTDLDAHSNHYVLPTEDGGYLLSGAVALGSQGQGSDRVYFIKINAQGEEEWTKAYSNTFFFAANYVPHIIEEPDGYVMIRHAYFDGSIHITKMTKNGDLVYTNEVKENVEWKIYPNPCQEEVNIEIPAEYTGGVLNIYNLEGRLVYQKNVIEERQNQIDLKLLSPSVYIIQIVHSNQQVLVDRLVITR